MTRIACQQLAPRFGDVEANRALTVRAIEEAVRAGAEIIVLPELITSGYMFESRAESAQAAISLGHPLLGDWARLAAEHDVLVIGGVCERGADGLIYNSAVAIDASGVRAVYRKLHLWDREKLAFVPGEDPPPVFETRHGRVSMLICYDLEFPELTRSVALAGAQLLAVPTNWPLVPRPSHERPPEVLIGMAAARVNRMAVACADRLGQERGQDWTGGSTIVGVDGWVAAETREPGLLLADIDLDAALEKRLTDHADAFGDRRPAFYNALVELPEGPAHG